MELDANEKVVADGVYRPETPYRVKAPHTISPFHNEKAKKMVCSRHEDINGLHKDWVILSQHGATASATSKTCFMPLLVWNKLACRMVKDGV